MSSLAIASVAFLFMLLGTLAAMAIARGLPQHHLGSESRDIVKLGLGVIGTLTALVLGLLVSASKATYDAQSGAAKELAAQMAVIDRVLARYGAESGEARGRLRSLAQAVLEQVWPPSAAATIDFTGGASRHAGEALFDAVAALEPKTDAQRLLKSRAQDLIVGMGQLRQRLVVNSDRTLPAALLVMLGIWQAVLFAGFGLLAARNATTVAVLVVCMLSVSGALFLVLELDRPFEGMVRVSDRPLRSVILHLGE